MESAGTKAKVLVIDDEPSILVSISILLEDEFDVLTVADPFHGLKQLAAEEISVLVSDQRMPLMSGDQFLRLARERSSATRILLTGFADIEALARAVNDGGIHAYVTKPWDPIAFRAIVRSAANQYRLSNAVRCERDLLHTVVNNIPDCVYVQDTAQRYTLVNPAFAKLAEMENPLEAVGKTELECLPGEFGRTASNDGRRVLETGQPITSKYDELRQDAASPRWYSSTRVPIRSSSDDRIEGLAGISIDITKHKEVEYHLQSARETAEASVRAKQEFLARISHEIRTPLNSILGMAELLSGTDLSGQQRKFIDVSQASGKMLMRLLGDLLDLSRDDFHELKLRSADLNLLAVVKSVLELHEKNAALRGIGLELEFGGDIPSRLLGDPERIEQVLGNLISYALKFTRQGRILVKVACLSLENEKASLEFAVGTGICTPLEKPNIVFESLGQAEDSFTEKYDGTGLGLSICRQLVRQMGGDISVETSFGAASLFRFTVTLPVAKAPRAKGASSGLLQTAENSLVGLKVLLAEDSKDIVLLIKAFLGSATVEVAVNGRRAVDKFVSERFDVVLMDIQMPEMDGLEATRLIREWESLNEKAATPIIACTAHASPEDSLHAGCNAHLIKPIFRKTLLDAIDKYVRIPEYGLLNR